MRRRRQRLGVGWMQVTGKAQSEEAEAAEAAEATEAASCSVQELE